MKAVKRFDPTQGTRLVSYAMHWIKAEIHEYILKNWRMVKVATTKAQRKLFFNLRSMKTRLKNDADDADLHRNTLTQAQLERVARDLNAQAGRSARRWRRACPAATSQMESQNDDGEEAYAPIAYLADDRDEPTRVIEAAGARPPGRPRTIGRRWRRSTRAAERIIEERYLKVNDDIDGGMTLHELAAEYGISAERIRQIEVAALKKMRKTLEPQRA